MSTKDVLPTLVVDCRNILGESCIWDEIAQRLYWVDIEGAQIWWYHPATGESQSFQMPGRMGAIAFRQSGGLVAALEDGVAAVDLEARTFERLVDIERPGPQVRLNDSRVDRNGRFICGPMDEARELLTPVYRIDADLTSHPIIDGVGSANSICFSPDGSIMYFADSPTGTILAYSYDADTGTPHDPKLFADLADQPGGPDGSAVDAEGYLWNGQYRIGGAIDPGRVVRYAPNGTVDRIVEVPVRTATCVCFGGSDLSTLYITTARRGMTPEAVEQQPTAGSLYALEVSVHGLPEDRFAG